MLQLVVVLKVLSRILEGLLLVTGVCAFLGFELNIFTVRDALLWFLPEHANVVFSKLTLADYAAFGVYALVVVVLWLKERFAPQIDAFKTRHAGNPLYGPIDTAIAIGAFALPLWFALTLSYLIADLAFPACALDPMATERCLDSSEPWDIVIILFSFFLVMFTTIGALLLGTIQRGQSGGGRATDPPPA